MPKMSSGKIINYVHIPQSLCPLCAPILTRSTVEIVMKNNHIFLPNATLNLIVYDNRMLERDWGWVVCRLQNVPPQLRSLYEVLLSYRPCRKVANSILTTCHTPPPAEHLITLNIKHMPGEATVHLEMGRELT